MFKDARYLTVAEQSADVVWERGLLKKGCGLCHGISGNGMVFVSLWRTSGDDKWLHRARQFASFALWWLNATERGEAEVMADVPDSLYNGRAGCALFLMALLRPAAGIVWPGIEV